MLVCYYWPTDVRVSVTCLLKRNGEEEDRGERGLLCNKPPVTHQQQHERDKQTHRGTLQASHSLNISFIFPPFLVSCVLPFSSLHNFALCFSCYLYAILSFHSVFPLTHCFSWLITPITSFFKSQVSSLSSTSLPLLSFSPTSMRSSILCSDMYNCRVELWNFIWIKGNHYFKGQGTWQQIILLNLAETIMLAQALTDNLRSSLFCLSFLA